jgi:leader peptidase (prepilin peptidase)/N-methyltransferase
VDSGLSIVVLVCFLFALGATVGSFLNVCICRLPEGGSLVRPGSHCPKCNHPIRWRDNIPIVSYVLLKARCRDCGARISPQYPIVEALTAALFVILTMALLSRGEPAPTVVVYLCLACALIAASFIDLKHTIIPDAVTIPGMILAPLVSLAFPVLQSAPEVRGFGAPLLGSPHLQGLVSSLLGMVAGAGFILLLLVAGRLVFRKEAMGWGDVKFMGMIGGFLGWKLVLLANLIAPVFGAIIGLLLLISKGEHYIPYGPFLSLGTLAVMIFGPDMLVLTCISL